MSSYETDGRMVWNSTYIVNMFVYHMVKSYTCNLLKHTIVQNQPYDIHITDEHYRTMNDFIVTHVLIVAHGAHTIELLSGGAVMWCRYNHGCQLGHHTTLTCQGTLQSLTHHVCTQTFTYTPKVIMHTFISYTMWCYLMGCS